MKNVIIYQGTVDITNYSYGCGVRAIFYPGNKINEGDSFNQNDFTYVDKLGAQWQKGHLLAKSLGGDNKAHNMLPMMEEFNNSKYKTYELAIKKVVENLNNLEKQLSGTPIFLGYQISTCPESMTTISDYRIPTQFLCNVGIYRQSDKMPINILPLKIAFENLGLDFFILGTKRFSTTD